MKHGPLALFSDDVVAVFGVTEPSIREKVISNMKEVQARGGKVLAIILDNDFETEKCADYCVRIPSSSFGFLSALLSVIPMQLFAYHVARLLGCEIDQPRNLAKSVTVE